MEITPGSDAIKTIIEDSGIMFFRERDGVRASCETVPTKNVLVYIYVTDYVDP